MSLRTGIPNTRRYAHQKHATTPHVLFFSKRMYRIHRTKKTLHRYLWCRLHHQVDLDMNERRLHHLTGNTNEKATFPYTYLVKVIIIVIG